MARGDARYFTGVPCKSGHVAERKTKSGACVICARERHKLWRYENRESERERSKNRYKKEKVGHNARMARWYQNNKDEHLERCRINREQNRDRRKQYHAQWYSDNKEVKQAKNRLWLKENPEKRRALRNRRRAIESNAVGKFTSSDVISIFEKQQYLCAGCYCVIGEKRHIDHIQPLSRGGSNWPENLQILCPTCNLSKSAQTMSEFMERQGRLLL